MTIQNKKPTVGFKNCEKQKKHTLAFSSTKPYKLSVLETNTDYLIKKRNELLTVLSSDYPDVVRCAIWYDLYNLKNMKNTHGGVLILVKLQASAGFTYLRIYLLLYLHIYIFDTLI